MDLTPPDLDHSPDRDGLVATKVQHPPQDEIGVESSRAEGCRVGRLQREREEDAGVERPVMICVSRENQSVCERFLWS